MGTSWSPAGRHSRGLLYGTIGPVTVSVVLPTFQRAALLDEALASLSAQTFSSWEALVVDDGSSDGSERLVEERARRDPRFRWIRRGRTPAGAPACRNIGAEQAQGRYLVFLDSDDRLAPYALEQRAAFMHDRATVAYAVFPMMVFEATPLDRPHLWNTIGPRDEEPEAALRRFLARDTPWQTTMPIWRRESFLELGGWDEALTNWQDWELHVRALRRGLAYAVATSAPPDCFVRRGPHERISGHDVDLEAMRNRAAMFVGVAGALASSPFSSGPTRQELARLLLHLAERLALLDAPWPIVSALVDPIRRHHLAPPAAGAALHAYVAAQKVRARTGLPLVGGGLYRLARLTTYFRAGEIGLERHAVSERALQGLRAANDAGSMPAAADWPVELAGHAAETDRRD